MSDPPNEKKSPAGFTIFDKHLLKLIHPSRSPAYSKRLFSIMRVIHRQFPVPCRSKENGKWYLCEANFDLYMRTRVLDVADLVTAWSKHVSWTHSVREVSPKMLVPFDFWGRYLDQGVCCIDPDHKIDSFDGKERFLHDETTGVYTCVVCGKKYIRKVFTYTAYSERLVPLDAVSTLIPQDGSTCTYAPVSYSCVRG